MFLGHETVSSGCVFCCFYLTFSTTRNSHTYLKRGDIKRTLTGIAAGSLILKFKFYQKAGLI